MYVCMCLDVCVCHKNGLQCEWVYICSLHIFSGYNNRSKPFELQLIEPKPELNEVVFNCSNKCDHTHDYLYLVE